MTNNVSVSGNSNTNSVNVSSGNNNASNVETVNNAAWHWSETAKQWAVSQNLVEGTDYSSKHYANASKEYYTLLSPIIDNLSNINTVKSDLTNINTVAGSILNVNAVGESIDNVNSVYTDLTDIGTVAENISDVNTVAEIAEDINAVSDDLTNIDSVVNNLSDIETVVTNISDINAVANNINDINSVADNEIDISTVADDINNISAVADNETNINAVANNLSNINAVVENASNINSVASSASNINSVAADLTNIDTVAAELQEVETSLVSTATAAMEGVRDDCISSIESAASSATDDSLDAISAAETEAIEAITDTVGATARWGNIVGILDDQSDLKTVFDTKADGLYYDPEESLLYLTCGDEIISEGIEVASGGGGGGGYATSITLTNLLDSDTLYIATGNEAILHYSYLDSDNLDATVQYRINNVIRYTGRIHSGDNVSFDISPYLDEGYNYIQVRVTDLNGANRTLIYVVNTTTLSISSTFDSTSVYSDNITFRYTPVGDILKTIHFEVDGTELETDTVETSGRQQSRVLTFNHGVHTLRVWASAVISEETVLSNILEYEVMYVSGNSVLIASDFNTTNYTEGEIVNIPLIIYSPSALTTDVNIYVNNVLTSELNVGRTQFTWSHVLTETGTVTILVSAGGSTRTFVLTVAESSMDVEAVSENMELYLTANGRNNNDTNKTNWSYENISCTLTGFNYVTNGWINNALKISNGASVTIPLQIFANDFRTNGKTIEIEFSTSNIVNFNTVVASCISGNRGFSISAQTATFKSEQSQVDVKFKEDEHIRLGFIVEPRSTNRLIYTYLNGIISGITQYPSDDDFSQVSPVNITLGGTGCDLDIYNIRVYDTALNHYDMLNNFIADTSNLSDKLKLYTANNIHDSYGNILYNKLINQIPIMTITGDLPQSKGDKKTVLVEYENQADSTKDFTMSGVTLDVQGTSSQYYPKKNYKISKLPTAYSLRTGSPAEKVFTLKADYMESSHAHNTGLARLVNECYTTPTPPQEENEAVRTTIDGFPIAMFYKATANSTPSYFGVYNFNNDKSSDNVFGFTNGCESWEFCNNTSDRCLFKTDDFSNSGDVLTDFEARYPKDYTNYSNLQSLITWVYDCYTDRSTTGIETFKDECEEHFNLEYLLTYYIISEFFGMVDSRAKNMFLNLYNDGLWYPVFYDLDTAIGLNNEGVNEFGFNIETHDSIGTENVFNGEGSALWYLVEQAYAEEIEELYNSLRNSGKLTYSKVMDCLYNEQISKICEAQYNADAEFKYISPLVNDGIATYLYTAQGSRLDHIKWWISGRFNYMDSKYTASDYKSNYMTLRLYTPSTWEDVEPDAEMTITPYADQYIRVKYGSYDVYERASSGTATTITPPDITFNDTETIIYGASKITSVGDLSPLYAGTIDASAAVKLTELKVGEGGDYSNTNLRGLTLGNNTLLQELDVRNCPNLTGALDLSGCTNLQTILATGTSITSVKLAEAGSITTLSLPSTITNLTVKNQNSITTFNCGTNISTLILENTNLDAKAIFQANPVTKVRITGIDWTLSDFTLLDDIYALIGSDENGNNTAHGILAGTIRMENAKESVINEYKEKFVGINFIVDTYADEDYICTDFGEVITTHDNKALLYT